MNIKSPWVAGALTLAFFCAPLAVAGTSTASQGPASSTQMQPNRMKTMHPGKMQMAGYRDWTMQQMMALQKALSNQGFQVKATGMWNDETRAAVMAFQKKQGLKPTGFPNQATVKKLGLKPPK